VPGPDPFGSLTALGLFAYGPVPGVELIPYFLGLLAWMGLALGAVLLSPISALLRLFRRKKVAPRTESASEPKAVSVPESPSEGKSNKA
jgi:hypothetical protein